MLMSSVMALVVSLGLFFEAISSPFSCFAITQRILGSAPCNTITRSTSRSTSSSAQSRIPLARTSVCSAAGPWTHARVSSSLSGIGRACWVLGVVLYTFGG